MMMPVRMAEVGHYCKVDSNFMDNGVKQIPFYVRDLLEAVWIQSARMT